jgi:8-oxo-dGTP diphosphatase
MAELPEIHVVAGALFDAAGRVLIAQRPRGRHMAGRWEFPGGKLGFGEDRLLGLKRELSEELGVTVHSARPLIRLYHSYPDRRVLLDFWRVIEYAGTPKGLDSQALAWVKSDDLPGHDLLEVDRAIVTALRLPQLARVISGAAQLAALSGSEAQTIFWHVAGSPAKPLDAAVVRSARAAGHRVFALGDGVEAIRIADAAGADGAVLRRHGQNLHVDREGAFLVGVVCEDEAGALEAIGEGAHFLVVAPQRGPLQHRELQHLCEVVGIPVFAGWYPDARRLEQLQMAGAHGCVVITTKRG